MPAAFPAPQPPRAPLRCSPPPSCAAWPAPSALGRCGRGGTKRPFIFLIRDFIGTIPWDHRLLVTVLVGQVAERLGEPDGIIAFDPSSCPKRGTPSVAVKRQGCSHRGKVDNCQVGVFMGYVSRHDHAWLDFRLSRPREWTRDEPRRHACHVLPDVQYQTRQEQCLEMLDAWGAQVPHGWVTGDDELGRHTRLRRELRERGERYVLGVPCTTTIRDLA